MRVKACSSWAEVFYRNGNRQIVMYSGRGPGKSFEATLAIIIQMHNGMHSRFGKPIKVVAVREFLDTIKDSTYTDFKRRIEELGLGPYFTINKDSIIHVNGSEIIFRGLSQTTARSFKGLSGINIMLFDEAQDISDESFNKALPTLREHKAEAWILFNPQNRFDPVYKRYVAAKKLPPGVVVIKLSLEDGVFVGRETLQQSKDMKESNPELWRHLFDGECFDNTERLTVMPYEMSVKCVNAWDKRPKDKDLEASNHVGLDVAQVRDKNCLVMRQGPVIWEHHKWTAPLYETARKFHQYVKDNAITMAYYDSTGIGASVESHLSQFEPLYPAAQFKPIHFSNAVAGADRTYTADLTNKEAFHLRKDQLGWSLRLRAERTGRLIAGQDIDPMRCLFINPELYELDEFLAELAQPIYEIDRLQIRIDKAPDGLSSPDSWDAAILSMGADSFRGLRSY